MVVQNGDGSVEFRFYRPNASAVFLAGDFNGWRRDCLAMRREADGWWVYTLFLAPGTYQFKYCVDGDWFLDYASFGLERGPFGWNSVVYVASKTPQTQAA